MALVKRSHEDRAQTLVREILTCYVELEKEASLFPSPRVNGLFEKLVLTHPQISPITTLLRHLCSDGEYQLEAYWAERILNENTRDQASAMLLNFTYYANYIDLIRMEMNAIASVSKGSRPKAFGVLGSGPLPLTSICILQSFKKNKEPVSVHNFDRDSQAISRSSELCCKLGYSRDEMHFQRLDVMTDRCDMFDFDVVYLASLVGITGEEKQTAISNIVKQMCPGALLVIRSAHSLRGLLYPVGESSVVSLTSALISQVTSSSKRGLVYVPNEKHRSDDSIWVADDSDLTWYYNYLATPSPAFSNSTKLQFVPMLWGSSTTFLNEVTEQIEGGANISYVLGFNEPDGGGATGGSAIPADTAAETWQREIEPLRELGVKLGAPAVTGAPNGFTWLENFFNACDGNCNVDFIPVHWYGNFEGLASHIGQVMGTYPNKTIWVTEYANNNVPLKDSQIFYNQSSQYFDRIPNITHYSYFGSFRSSVSNVGPNAAMLTEKGKLTDIGSWYLGRSATGNVPRGAAGRSAVFGGGSIVILLTAAWCLL
ncbi:MAG: hypothetical protein Q9208_000409 [Pyrenodesmia sp. 3 TL-2023]